MGTGTHAGAGSVGVVWRAAAFGDVEVAFHGEGVGVFEVGGVVVGCPCILSGEGVN